MIYLFGFVGLIYLTYQAGKQDGKWGCFTALMLLLFVAFLVTLFDGE